MENVLIKNDLSNNLKTVQNLLSNYTFMAKMHSKTKFKTLPIDYK